jgi:hypothetical protein
MKKKVFKNSALFLTVLAITALSMVFSAGVANALPVWGTDATGELTGSRTSPAASGIYATQQWNNGGFTVAWNISEAMGVWTYKYTVTGAIKETSHFILEVTNDANPFKILPGTDTKIEGPQTWTAGGSNPLMPNPIYGIKFDFGALVSTYTIVTDRAPVYGVFYAKDGTTGGADVVAWSNALNSADYKTNGTLTSTDFIVRPDGATPIPEPATIILLGFGLLAIPVLRKFKK